MTTFKEMAEAEFTYNEALRLFQDATIEARAEYLSMLGSKALLITNAEVDEAVRNNPKIRKLFENSVTAYNNYKLLAAELDQNRVDLIQREVEASEKIAKQAVIISEQLARIATRTH